MSRTPAEVAEISDAILKRVYSEFMEMPGLQLTCKQAQRLWGLDEQTCLRHLEFLVDSNFLCRPGKDRYQRLWDGTIQYARLKMASAQVDGLSSPKHKEAV
jgi:hypothetical protein